MGFIKNLPKVMQGVDLSFKKVKYATDESYRNFIWEVFKRILRETPQWSGKAVANWNLSIDAPNYNFDDKLGDEIGSAGYNFEQGLAERSAATHQRGDERWMRVARDRARPVMRSITTRSKVFISNGVRGDGDEVGAELYMQALQNEGYWAYKLREVNKPYEVAQESVVIIAMKFGKKGLFAPNVGGESWKQN